MVFEIEVVWITFDLENQNSKLESLTEYLTLDMAFSGSLPQFPHLKNGIASPHVARLCVCRGAHLSGWWGAQGVTVKPHVGD